LLPDEPEHLKIMVCADVLLGITPGGGFEVLPGRVKNFFPLFATLGESGFVIVPRAQESNPGF
jgi:hypothetical protein